MLAKRAAVIEQNSRVARIFIGTVIICTSFLVFFWPAGYGLGGVQGGAGAGREGARGPSLYVQVGFEAMYSWKQHTVLDLMRSICHTSIVLFDLILMLVHYDMYVEVKQAPTSMLNSSFGKYCKMFYQSVSRFLTKTRIAI